MKPLYLGLVATLIIASAALWACGGSDSNNDDNNSNNPTESSSTTPENTRESSDTPSSSDGNTSDELKDLAGKLAGKQMSVAYDFTTSGGGTDTTGSFKLFWKSKDAYRIDIIDDAGSSTSFILKDGTQYVCSPDGSGSGTCIKSPITTFPLPFLGFFTDPDTFSNLIDTEVNGVNFDKSSETIGGEDGTCYKSSVGGASAQYCFSNDGLLLRLDSGTSGASFKLEATSVDNSVADSDLELPYAATDIGG